MFEIGLLNFGADNTFRFKVYTEHLKTGQMHSMILGHTSKGQFIPHTVYSVYSMYKNITVTDVTRLL